MSLALVNLVKKAQEESGRALKLAEETQAALTALTEEVRQLKDKLNPGTLHVPRR